jgi:dCTP deaminase
MLLSDQSIQQLLKKGTLVVKPRAILKSASLRLHLSNQFAQPGGRVGRRQHYLLQPKKLILSSTVEQIRMPNDHAGLYDGSTTLARIGITSHMGSMLVSPGSQGNLTLEIFNASDASFELKAGMRIGQLLVLKLDTPSKHPQPTRSSYKGTRHTGVVMPKKKEIYRTSK